METKHFRDITLSIAAIIFSISLIYAVYVQYNFWNSFSDEIDEDVWISAECEKINENYIANVEVENTGKKEIISAECKILDKGNLISDIDSYKLSNIGPGSSDVCSFVLNGELIKPVKFEVVYDGYSKKTVCDVFE